ncbi:MAG TPA: DUF3267 domain-containing protein [Herpetosiphon sp.]|uniref:Zincin peptidase n=1 Tax=Herpetosiphon aurantiacus (strain ATCC 23779 / DSM 785 / 114-95) TaxID=316274 RepID=A9B829_HERA2|nr:DUF3267 domain-containing protein [Herpetosiphon sp.]ABX05962.1 hypothetical protein Haur_3326 [Herpetosiphon aurantiacus DSM 785]HBW50550.1 DUF3267 domain-containing protein [Herpetosiphon sp.]
MANKPQPQSGIVEGLTGRLPFLIGSLVSFFSFVLLMRIRTLIHGTFENLDFEGIQVWLMLDAMIIVILAPLSHTISHSLGLMLQKQPWQAQRRLIYPRVRPRQALTRRQVIGYLLAPLALNGVLLLGIIIKPFSAYLALWGAVNLGLTSNDLWKVLGVWRFPESTSFVVHQNHLERTEAGHG